MNVKAGDLAIAVDDGGKCEDCGRWVESRNNIVGQGPSSSERVELRYQNATLNPTLPPYSV